MSDQIVNPEQWIAAQVTALHPIRPPMLYVAHPVGAQPGDVLATCTECRKQALYGAGSPIDLRWICDHDAPVQQHRDPDLIVAFNLARALRWWQWLRQLRAAVWSIPWMASVHVCDDTNPDARALGMRDNIEHVRRHDGVIFCGGRASSGMRTEGATAREIDRPVFQVTGPTSGEPPLNHPASVPWRRWQP